MSTEKYLEHSLTMPEFLKDFQLRNRHLVYKDRDNYRVVSVDKHGTEHSQNIPSCAIEYLMQVCHGKTVTAKQAAILFGPRACDFDIPFIYGHKLEYYTRKMLLVLAATDRAKMEKKGKGYSYYID